MNLTPQGSTIIEELASRYQVSADAVMALLRAVIDGGGSMAQFSHPELGGSGQWMRGGMTMVGDMFNHSLKAKVDGLCSELASIAATQSFFAQPTPTDAPARGDTSLFVANTGGAWWPAGLGLPSSTGSQNNIRYAVFPSARRLVIEVNGQLTIYDTLNHQIGGVGQQQGTGASLTFSSQFGTVGITELPVVQEPGTAQASVVKTSATAETRSTDDERDIFNKIERLAELRQKGIISEEEFAGKKAELISRL